MVSLSVVLCTWNNHRRLAITLDALAACAAPVPWELVVVNNNCKDDTDKTVAAMKDKLPIVYVHEPKQGLSNARNAGVRHATGELIVFTDDDVKPSRDWLVEYWQAYQQHPVGRFWGGPIESEFDGPLDPEIVRYAPLSVRGLDWGPANKPLATGERFIAANWGCPRSALPNDAPFDPELGLDPNRGFTAVGEETAVMEGLEQRGYQAHYLANAKIKHHVPTAKLTLQHVADRRRARFRFRSMGEQVTGRCWIAGVPLWLWVLSGRLYLRWLRQKLAGRQGVTAYMKWAECMGRIDAIRGGSNSKGPTDGAATRNAGDQGSDTVTAPTLRD